MLGEALGCNANLLPKQLSVVCDLSGDGAHTDQRGIHILVINGKKRASCQGSLSVKAEVISMHQEWLSNMRLI